MLQERCRLLVAHDARRHPVDGGPSIWNINFVTRLFRGGTPLGVEDVADYLPNGPPTNVFWVLKVKFYSNIFTANHSVSQGGLVRDREVGGSNPLAPTKPLS